MLLRGQRGGRLPLLLPCSTTTTAANKTGSWRFLQPAYRDKTAPCSAACPAAEDIPRIEMQLAQGAMKEAWQTLAEENPFPAICGRVCFHPCERVCNRSGLDEPVAIQQLERSIGDRAASEAWALPTALHRPNGKNAAVIGAGPAGLAAAYFLVRLGFGCEVFEARPAPGGLLRWGIPTYRLPADILTPEIRRVQDLGVRIHCDTPLSASLADRLCERFDALVIACGSGHPIGLKIAGAAHAADGLELLSRLRSIPPPRLQGRAAVIGGGNTAVDVARSLFRLGADPILVYRRRREDMPAFEPEVQSALEEGVQLMELVAPIRIDAHDTDSGPAYMLTLQKMAVSREKVDGRSRVIPREGQTTTLQVDHVVSAIGAAPAADWQLPLSGDAPSLQMSHSLLATDVRPRVFVGDLTTPAKSVSDAIASGKQAALALDIFFSQGRSEIDARLATCRVGEGPALSFAAYADMGLREKDRRLVTLEMINLDYFEPAPRAAPTRLNPAARRRTFDEIEAGLSPGAARAEAGRCFNCGSCNACDNCRLYCPESAVQVAKSVRRIDLDYCKGCGVCVHECPRNAMSMED